MTLSHYDQTKKYSRLAEVYLYLSPTLNMDGRVDIGLSGATSRNLLPANCPQPTSGTYIGQISELEIVRDAEYKRQGRGNDRNPYTWQVEQEEYLIKFNLIHNHDPATFHLYKLLGATSMVDGEYFEGGNTSARTSRILIVIVNKRDDVLQYVECRLYYNVLIKASAEKLTSRGDVVIAMEFEVGNSTDTDGDCLPEGARKMRGWFVNPANNTIVDPADYV